MSNLSRLEAVADGLDTAISTANSLPEAGSGGGEIIKENATVTINSDINMHEIQCYYYEDGKLIKGVYNPGAGQKNYSCQVGINETIYILTITSWGAGFILGSGFRSDPILTADNLGIVATVVSKDETTIAIYQDD